MQSLSVLKRSHLQTKDKLIHKTLMILALALVTIAFIFLHYVRFFWLTVIVLLLRAIS